MTFKQATESTNYTKHYETFKDKSQLTKHKAIKFKFGQQLRSEKKTEIKFAHPKKNPINAKR